MQQAPRTTLELQSYMGVFKPLFQLGNVYLSPGAQNLMKEAEGSPLHLVARHVTGDWLEMDDSDVAANEAAAKQGGRVLSAYTVTDKERLYVITEADRRCTTLLLPSEY
jgi:hypothetical protein